MSVYLKQFGLCRVGLCASENYIIIFSNWLDCNHLVVNIIIAYIEVH